MIEEQKLSEVGDETVFATTADTGRLEWQVKRLIRSLSKYVPESEVVVFVPTSSFGDLSQDTIQLLGRTTTVVTGEIPIQKYPISALIQAFVKAEEVSNAKRIVALDTDTVFTNRMQIPEGGDTWLRSADVGAQYWTTDSAWKDWEQLYEKFDLSLPETNDRLIASVDNKNIPPYWNSGVVATTDLSLPTRWLDITRKIHRDDSLPVGSSEFFLDQISLALAVRSNDVRELPVEANFPLGGSVWIPSEVQVIHYGDERNLSRIICPELRRKLRELDALPPLTPSSLWTSLLDIASTQSGKVLSYEQKERIKNTLNSHE